MGKKKKRIKQGETSEMLDVTLYGSLNGWLKIISDEHEEIILRPKDHTDRDTPIVWYNIGKYLAPISVEDTE